MLVTGDLRVSDSLTVDPGKKFEFWLDPDTSLAYGDPDRTDLIVEGFGAALTSVGTAENTILYTSRSGVGEWMPGDWYGIRVRSGAQALLRWSEIRAAYSGIEVTPGADAEVESSEVHGCQFAGVNNLEGQVQVHGSELTHNGVYGVRCEFPGLVVPPPPSRVDSNRFSYNGHAAVSFTCVSPLSHAQHEVLYNQVVSGNVIPFPAIHGIEVTRASDSFRVDGNHVSGFDQAGIALDASSPSIAYDTVVSNSVNGIACLNSSHPEVRRNTVNSNQFSGIACFEGSNPHVRRNSVNSNLNGVYCDPSSFPDLGTVEDPGYNSILFDNVKWVNQIPVMSESVMARLNWWGVVNPNSFLWKFVGNIAYGPWLTEPPPDEDGQQSVGSASSLLETGLGRPLPMPMRGTVRIPFQIAQAGPVSLAVVDASGRLVRALVHGEREPGRYNVTWDRSDNSGRLMPEGVYFLRFEAGARRDVQKVVVMR